MSDSIIVNLYRIYKYKIFINSIRGAGRPVVSLATSYRLNKSIRSALWIAVCDGYQLM